MKTAINMNNKIVAFFALFIMTIGASAQIDRSQPPVAGPEPEISIDKPEEFTLKNGLKVLVVENHKLPRVSYSLRIDNAPVATGKKAGIESLIGSMLGNGTTTISKDDFNEEIDFLGASLNFGISGGFASSLTKYSDRVLELMADAAINPLLTEEEFDKEKTKLLEGLKADAKSADAISGRVGLALSYGTNHPYGEFVTEETIKNVTFGDAVAFYEKYFNPNHAYLVVIGDVKYKDVKKQIQKYFKNWSQSVAVNSTVPKPSANVQYTQINFVDVPDATQSNLSITNNVNLKMNDEDYHIALITNNILGGGGEGYLFKNLREDKGYTYGAYSSLGTDRYGASRFNATAKVRNAVTDSAVIEALKEIKRIRTEPVDAQLLKDAKAKYVGNFVMALERPQTIANYALNIKLNDLPEDFYTTYLQKINDVTVEDIQRVANKYFKEDNLRIIVVGNGAEVLENLEKTGIPIKYFDKYANATEKPVFSKPLPAGLTADAVINNYITAIGGEANLNKINTILVNSDVTIQGAPFKPKATVKQMAPNKSYMEIVVEGMGAVMQQSFNGESGYMVQQGQKTVMDDKMLSVKKAEKGLFPELYLDASSLELESIMTIDGADVYKVKVTNGDVASYRYYDTKTNYLVRTEESAEMGGQTMTTITDYSNYKEVDGVKFPNTMKIATGPQVLSFETTEVKINEGVSDADFN
ncbi:putative Zn-dependent peptidase [Winogradskyella pacifica]|uniref:Putative Zn-dependent peptidase n=1 Tax=Winogradskyella pacifica TaxID=664642 RepID=A0A3D9N511_9FLAO|nr:insulinase family protein [Winogradskyella pacifica]REE27878.1 putative Zn-dependent peptidase [Winogradskyella pacifica]